jgi:hypothetical protein
VWVAAWRRSAAATLTGPARLSTPIARLRKVAMTVGALPVRTWEASSAKVTSRTQCRPFSIVQWPRSRSARRAGRACSNGRLVIAVHGHRPPPVGVQVAPLAGDLGGVRDPEVADADGLEAAQLDAAVAAVAGAVGHGHAVPGQAGAACQQPELVGLDHQQVVRLLDADQELSSLGVGLQRIRGDHHPVKVEPVQQGKAGTSSGAPAP